MASFVCAANISETITDEVCGGSGGGALAWVVRGGERHERHAKDLTPHAEKLEKFVEDVKWVLLVVETSVPLYVEPARPFVTSDGRCFFSRSRKVLT